MELLLGRQMCSRISHSRTLRLTANFVPKFILPVMKEIVKYLLSIKFGD